MAVRLFIENKEVELNKSVQFAITKQFEDVTNPTDIINDWSKTVSIPFSVHNNELFGHIYNPDKVTVSVPVNLVQHMKISEDFVTNDEIMHTDECLPMHYGYPEILYPDTLYKSYFNPNIILSSLTSYSVVRGTVSTTYETLLSERTSLGKQACTFTLTSGMTDAQRCITIKVQGTPTVLYENPPYVTFYMNDFPDGKYNLTFDTKFFDTTQKQFNFKNIVLTRSDSVVWAENMNVGVYFDPMMKLNFRLEFDNFVLMTGYAKMNEVKQVNGVGTYEITLFGRLGKVFQEMQKITFDKTSDLTDYIIEGDKYVSEYITKDLVYSSWTSTGQVYTDLREKGQTGYRVTDIIGFAPNNSFSEDFDYETFQNGANSSDKFTNVLGTGFTEDTGLEPDTVIPDGMLPREIGEYRSYKQLPFIYWNKLFKIFVEKAKEVTGYDVELDNNWFTVNNPYWYRLVYMLKPLTPQKGNSSINTYSGTTTSELTWSRNTGGTPYSTQQNLGFTMSVVSEKTPRLVDNKFMLETYDNINVTDNTIEFYLTGEMNHDHDILFTKNNCFLFYLNFIGANGYTETKYVIVYRGDTTNEDVLAAVEGVRELGGYEFPIAYENRYGTYQSGITSSSNYGWHITVGGNNLLKLNKYKFGDYVTVSSASKWLNNSAVYGAAGTTSEFCWLSNGKLLLKMDVQQDVFNSNSYFTLNDLWNNEYNLFSEILKYCKMYRIGVFLDDYEKKITFKALKDYFSGYTVEDWTDKIDKSKDFIIKPITFENKYVMFNYEDSETEIGERYKEKFGVNYGDYRLVTQYNFNTDTTELFEGITPSIVSTDNVLSWTNLYDNHKVVYSFPSEIYVNCKDKDNKFVSVFGSFFFHRGRKAFSTESSLNLRSVSLSDDTLFQQNNNTYFYTQLSGEVKDVTYYPNLDIVYGNNMCVFNIPKENYTYTSNYAGKKTIYSNFWEKYINERYNVQNKVITCYVVLKPTDYNGFQYNKFVKVGHQICMVNKIYDYDVTSSQSTKVDLITIQDVSGYTTNNY